MAARPRTTRKTHSLPEHLYYDARYGTYRIKLINGKYKSLGADRDTAVAITREYNLVARPQIGITVESLLYGDPMLSQPFAVHVPKLLERIIREEQPSDDFMKTMQNDAQRAIAFFSEIPGSQINLKHITDYINQWHGDASPNVQNRKISWLQKLFSYAVDEGLMPDNLAAKKKKRRLEPKKRQRLKLEWYRQIHAAAPLWLQTAMDLSLQTTHARLEISRIKYKIAKPGSRSCGCIWFNEPKMTPAGLVYGTLYIHRQKVKQKEASHVAIPIGQALKNIIDRSRDRLISDYVVHRLPTKCSNPLSKKVKHISQLTPDYISRGFSKVRDEVGCCNHLTLEQRPTFHEIRALAAHLFSEMGIDPQSRMAHTDAKSTKIYTQDHVDWVHVPFAEIKAG